MERIFPAFASPTWTRTAEGDEAKNRQLERSLISSTSAAIILAAFAWGLIFLSWGERPAALLSLGYSAFTLLTLLLARAMNDFRWYLPLHFALGLLIPFTHMIMLGGFWNSSSVMIWSLVIPLGALVFYGARASLFWWSASIALLVIAGFLDGDLQRSSSLPLSWNRAFFVLNIASVSGIVFVTLRFFLRKRDEAYALLRREEQRSEHLLLNILPEKIARTLKQEERVIADYFDDASILFADLAGFTSLTSRIPPIEMVKILNEVFSFFDSLVEKYQVEKIRTIGDNYMIAAGVPETQTDHAHRLANVALEMQEYLSKRAASSTVPLSFRIGLNCGPVVGGVIGRKKFVYDVWGEAVNLASRMESQGVPGRIQVADGAYRLLREDFVFEPRGEIEVKGAGKVRTWFLKERKHDHKAG